MYICFTVGFGFCQTKQVCDFGEHAYLDLNGGAYCDCGEGKERFQGNCETIFTQSVCNKGEILLPRNYQETKSCPKQFSCTSIYSCSGYQNAKEEIKEESSENRKEASEFLKTLICNKTPMSICCPDLDNKSLFSPSNLLRVLSDNQGVICSRNPCSQGRWPWLSEKGLQCLQYEENVEICPTYVENDDRYLICHEDTKFDVLFASKKNCGRRKKFQYGRCVSIFRGK